MNNLSGLITGGLGVSAGSGIVINAIFTLTIGGQIVGPSQQISDGGLWLPPGEVKNLFKEITPNGPFKSTIKAYFRAPNYLQQDLEDKDIEITLQFGDEELKKLYRVAPRLGDVGIHIIGKPHSSEVMVQIKKPDIKTLKNAIQITTEKPKPSVTIKKKDK